MFGYAPGTPERTILQMELRLMREEIKKNGPFKVPLVVNGEEFHSKSLQTQSMPCEHRESLCIYSEAGKGTIKKAIETALEAKPEWERMTFNDRAAIFLKAADLLTTKYRYKILAATMLGQGKTAWQAEIDASAELADFWRFNCWFAANVYADQPVRNFPGTWNRSEYRALEGFVVAYSPFNFTAIAGNLVSAPALMGNVVLWKPSPSSMYSNYIIMEILKEAGLPDGVIQFIPGDAELITEETFNHPEFAGLHFTGSTFIFNKLWKKIATNLSIYKSFPRVVGETGGKNMHFLHKSCDVKSAVYQTIRGAFENQGQKCSATSRVYIPDTVWPEFSKLLKEEVKKIKQGSVEDFENFVTAVINKTSYDKIVKYIKGVEEDDTSSILVGGGYSDKKGYFIEPTVILTTDHQAKTMTDELFGPVVTCYVYPAEKYEEYLEIASNSTSYALTGAVFALERQAIVTASNILRNCTGNFYINDKCTGAVVGQQPFGGARGSGTNDKAGSALNLLRWVSPRTIKENFEPLNSYKYPSNTRD